MNLEIFFAMIFPFVVLVSWGWGMGGREEKEQGWGLCIGWIGLKELGCVCVCE